ncbi:MAG: hypothetical protein JSR96_03655 [Proteobacteria bacterium]|nr:hypothetical protein [Pseudomonadota bacterium]
MVRSTFAVVAAGAILGSVLALPTQAGGIETKSLWEQQVGQWGDARTAPETRTRCKSSFDGAWPWGGKWKACKQWETNARVMEVYATLIVRGPKDISKADKKLVERCGQLASASASQVDQPDPAPAQAAARTTFQTCAGNVSLTGTDRFTVSVETRSAWSKWH